MPKPLMSPRAAALAALPLVLLGAAALVAAVWEPPWDTDSNVPNASMSSDVSSSGVAATLATQIGVDYFEDYTHVFPRPGRLVNESTHVAQFAESR